MPLSTTALAFLLLINGTISAVYAIVLWSYHHTRLTKYAAFVLLAISFVAYWYMLEILAPRTGTKFVFHRLRYIAGDVLLAPYWFGFVLIYLRRDDWLKPSVILGALIFPLITIALVLTNGMHELVWVGESITSPPIRAVTAETFGDWLWAHIVYSYVLTAVSIGLLIKSLTRSEPTHRRQTLYFLIAMFTPIIGAFLNLLLEPTAIKLVPLSISFSGVILVWSFSRNQLLELTPIARNVILENMRDLVIVFDPQDRIIDANPIVANRFLDDDQSLVGKPMATVIPNWHEIKPNMDASCLDEKTIAINGRLFDINIAPIHSQNQEPVGSVATLHDITERRRLEDEFQQAQKMEAIGLLAGGVAHDLNNSLTVIRSYTDLLLHEKTNLPAKPHRYAEAIKRSSDQATALVQQLLAFSRKQDWQPQPLDLNQAILDVTQMVSRLIGETIQVITNLDPTLHWLEADPAQLRQLIINLAINGRDAMPSGGKLTLTTQNVTLTAEENPTNLPPGDYTLFSVTDTGVGMDEATAARIFEPFFTTKETGKGTGLGLSTVYGVVSKSQGDITVDSTIGFGTTFSIYFPAQRKEPEPALPISAPDTNSWTTGSETILVVEDEATVLELVEEILEGQGYQLLTATDGLGAVSISNAFTNHIDLLLTDVVMPGLNGRELAETLLYSRPTMKVIYMSGYTKDIVSRNMANATNIRLLDKPFTPDELIKLVRQTLDTPLLTSS
ncbi:MAG: histidine kinase N-terminal 7TM domain-containing protein [Chloroflexota bacterium]